MASLTCRLRSRAWRSDTLWSGNLAPCASSPRRGCCVVPRAPWSTLAANDPGYPPNAAQPCRPLGATDRAPARWPAGAFPARHRGAQFVLLVGRNPLPQHRYQAQLAGIVGGLPERSQPRHQQPLLKLHRPASQNDPTLRRSPPAQRSNRRLAVKERPL
jgi:hypothetical protein